MKKVFYLHSFSFFFDTLEFPDKNRQQSGNQGRSRKVFVVCKLKLSPSLRPSLYSLLWLKPCKGVGNIRLLYFLLCVTAKCYVSYICIKVAIYFGNLNVKNRYVSWVLWSVQWRDIIINSVSKCTLLHSALLPCLKSQPGQFKLFSFFLPKSLVRVRPVSRKCVGRSDQSATCLCALYLSECSILVCVCLCLSVYVVIVCMNAKFMCVLCSFACLIQCICLHRVFSLVSSLCPLLVQMLFFSSVICVFVFL